MNNIFLEIIMRQKTHLINILKFKRIIIILSLILIFIFFLSNCNMHIISEYPITKNYLIIEVNGNSFTLSWDAPSYATPV